MSKVKLTKEVAGALSMAQLYGIETDVVEMVASGKSITNPFYLPINDIDLQTLMRALVNGYEVEKTPEEAVRDYYVRHTDESLYSRRHAYEVDMTVRKTLDLLGIKIEGVNA